MPLVNEVVVPIGAKDLFNASQPSDDAQFLDGVLNPVLPGVLNALYGIEVPEGERNDLVDGLPDRHPGAQPAGERACPPSICGSTWRSRRREDRRTRSAWSAATTPASRTAAASTTRSSTSSSASSRASSSAFRRMPGWRHLQRRAEQRARRRRRRQRRARSATSSPTSRSRTRASSTGTTPSQARPEGPRRASTGDVPRRQEHEAEAGVTVELDELNDSGVNGTATLTANGEQTDVSDHGRGRHRRPPGAHPHRHLRRPDPTRSSR